MSKSKNQDSPSIFQVTDSTVSFEVGEQVLVMAEPVLQTKKTKQCPLKYKIEARFDPATIIKVEGDVYIIKYENGKQKKAHRKILKKKNA